MPEELTSLVIKVDAVDATAAERKLDKLEKTSGKLEKTNKKVTESSKAVAAATRKSAMEQKEAARILISLETKTEKIMRQRMETMRAINRNTKLSSAQRAEAHKRNIRRSNEALQATKKLDTGVKKLTKSEKVLTKETNDLSRSQKKVKTSSKSANMALKSTALAAGAATAAYAALRGSVALFNKALERAKVIQSFDAQLKTATGSIEDAASAMERLRDFATKTPFTLNQSIEAFVKLKNLGLDPSAEAMRSYGNTAAAMGKSMTQMIEAVADASTMEFERLKEFGIKAKQSADSVTFTFRGVATTVKKNAADIEGYLQGIGDVQFAGAMADQMNTIGGQLSNLEDSWDNFFDTLNKQGLSDVMSDALTEISKGLQGMTDWAASGGADQIIKDISTLAQAARHAGDGVKYLADNFGWAVDFAVKFNNALSPDFMSKLEQFNKSVLVKGDVSGLDAVSKAWDESAAAIGGVEKAQEDLAKASKRREGESQADFEFRKELAKLTKEFADEEVAGIKKVSAAKKTASAGGGGGSGRQDPSALELKVSLGLGTNEEQINVRFERDRAMILENTRITEEQRTELEIELTQRRNAELMELDRNKNQMILGSAAQTFDGLAGLTLAFAGEQSAAYKVLFGISKGFAIADATLNMWSAASKAFATGVTPVDRAAHFASALTFGGNIISSINSLQAGNFANGGIVGGTSFTGDNMQANVNSGEMILNGGQQKELFSMANGSSGGSGGVKVVINNLPGQEVDVKETDTDQGKQLEFTIKQTEKYLATQFDKGVGPLTNSIARNTNARRK